MTVSIFYITIFLFMALALYWLLPAKARNYFLLAISCAVLASLQWQMIILISTTIIVDYWVGRKLLSSTANPQDNAKTNRKMWLILSLSINVGLLCVFKYYNFFIGSFTETMGILGVSLPPMTIKLFVPIGISYYTFKSMSYTIDLYYGKIPTLPKFSDYALYVAFFPEILAGPIDRARVLLPRLSNPIQFDRERFADGINLILIGLFKKLYIADNLGLVLSKPVYNETIMAIYLYSFQIYCDFSGYTDIARGVGKLFGYDLAINFKFPYVSANPSEFWQRWHISLSTWLRDYVFTPLGGALRGLDIAYRNLAITMILIGLWHGASWTFFLWGVYQGILLIGHRILQPVLKKYGAGMRRILNRKARHVIKVIVTFQLVSAGWIIFRANSVNQIGDYLKAIFHGRESDINVFLPVVYFILPLIVLEIVQSAFSKEEIFRLPRIPVTLKAVVVAVMLYLMIFEGVAVSSFIYAQF